MIENSFNNINLSGKRNIARTISKVESDNGLAVKILKNIFPKIGNAYRIGITGPPGAGKSTITNQLVKLLVNKNYSVAVIAVDPTSPFTGGALLGDRVRMTEIGQNEKVFIRSMATRGSLGGLSKKTIDVADVLDAAGYDFIIFETVGVGQSELDIVQAADTTVVVLVPESGDSVQAMKAGLMEIADLFVLNKSDRPASEQAVIALQTMLMMKPHDETSWLPKIIKTVASENIGIQDILNEIFNHNNYLMSSGLFYSNREKRLKRRIKEIVEHQIKDKLWDEKREDSLDVSLKEIVTGNISPYQIADDIINSFKNDE